MRVVTISSELGGGGAEIGEQVARTLGYDFVDERVSDTILRKYGLTKFGEVYDSAPTILDLLRAENLLIVSMLNEIVEALAKRGNVVILSRIGFAILGTCSDVLNVHVVAPLDRRVERLATAEGSEQAADAADRVHEDDNVHRTFVRRFYDRQYEDPAGYGIVVDTGTLSYEAAAQQIVQAASMTADQSAAPGAVTTADLEIDPVLAGAVDEALAEAASR
jgi:cytidylate kinase